MEPISFVFADRATVPGFLGTEVQHEVCQHLLQLKADKLLVVTDEQVDELHGDYFEPLQAWQGCSSGESLSPVTDVANRPTVHKIVLPSGDAAKSWEHLTMLMNWNFEVGATKKSVVVAFGGGALLNIAGLYASIAYRGMKLVYIPTTFLAMHDVVTSMKTSICFDGRKNNIGSFYAATKILIDTAFCRTLPRMELFSGLGELMKNAALLGGAHAEGVASALSKDRIDACNGGSGEEFSLCDEVVLQLVRLGIEAKMSILATDALEKNSGMIFEYGHTVSHAIEKAYGDGTIPHGLGVTYGMLSSSFAAEKMGIMTAEARQEHDDLCNMLLVKWPLPEPRPNVEQVMERAMKDSKRGICSEGADEVADVILRRVGDVLPTETQMLCKFPAAWVAEWLVSMGFPLADKAYLKSFASLKSLDSAGTPAPPAALVAEVGGTP